MRLVQGEALAPAVFQRRGLVVGGEDALIVGAAEDGEGSEVLLGVPSLRGWVDEDGAAGRPHDVAVPQVAVGARGTDVLAPSDHVGNQARLAVVEVAGVEALAQPLDEVPLGGGEDARVQVRHDSLTRIERSPRLARGRGRGGLGRIRAVRAARFAASARAFGEGEVSFPHPAVTRVPVGGGTQVRGTGSVRVGEGAAECFGILRRWRHRDHARFLQPRRPVIEHGHDRRPGVRGLGEPCEARDLVGDPPATAIRLSYRLHRRVPVPFHCHRARGSRYVRTMLSPPCHAQGARRSEGCPGLGPLRHIPNKHRYTSD